QRRLSVDSGDSIDADRAHRRAPGRRSHGLRARRRTPARARGRLPDAPREAGPPRRARARGRDARATETRAHVGIKSETAEAAGNAENISLCVQSETAENTGPAEKIVSAPSACSAVSLLTSKPPHDAQRVREVVRPDDRMRTLHKRAPARIARE